MIGGLPKHHRVGKGRNTFLREGKAEVWGKEERTISEGKTQASELCRMCANYSKGEGKKKEIFSARLVEPTALHKVKLYKEGRWGGV